MPERRLVAGLDLGSTKTCAVIAEVAGDLPRSPLAKILGVGLAKNSGVRRGMVRDIDETTRSVAAALKDAERMAGARVNDVTCGIAGEHVSARGSTGVVAVSGEEISPQDVARVNEVARAVSLGRDHELLHDIPQEYVVDQQRGISDPVGMTGTRLEVGPLLRERTGRGSGLVGQDAGQSENSQAGADPVEHFTPREVWVHDRILIV